jgi:transcription elongation factor Elf1
MAEHRQIVSVVEILAVRWECPKCHVAMSFSPSQTIRLPTSCPGCHADAVEPHLRPEHRVYSEFVDALRAVIQHQQSRAVPAGTIRLELPAESTRAEKGGT